MSRASIRFATIVCCAGTLSLLTVYLQATQLGLAFLEQGHQIEYHRAILQGTSTDPWQYRVLSEYLVEGVIGLAGGLGIPHPVAMAFIFVRVLQNLLIFVVAAYYYRKLGLTTYLSLLGMSLLAWGIMHSGYQSDLQFNTFFDVLFYLAGALLVIVGRDPWIIPIAAVAAANRETAVFIPFLPVASRLPFPDGRTIPRKPLAAMAVSAVLFALVLMVVRLHYGPRPMRPNPTLGLGFLLFNVWRSESWIYLLATLGFIPLMAISSIRGWPRSLRGFFWLIVPVWFLVHVLAAKVAEARLFLVPQAVVFIPGALFGITYWSRWREAPLDAPPADP
jgi:hypothetical protein